MTERIAIDPRKPSKDAVVRAVATIRRGGVVVVPTRTLYGLAVDCTNPAAVQKIFTVKGRAADNPLLILVPAGADLSRWVCDVPEDARRLMERFWPGNLTLVCPAQPHLPTALTAGSNTIGIRQPGHVVARTLVEILDGAVTGTSANRSGQPGCARIDEFDQAVARQVDLILDAGPLAGGRGSTVVDTVGKPPRVLREGTVAVTQLRAIVPEISTG